MGERMMVMSRGEEGGGNGGGNTVVRWDKFFPRMFLRVLLVEADDSTRHIIAALLRKCNYKVAAVADGLKAWETLQEKCQLIDIVLTEVELPSVSGFCLLTMIKESEACKNIPVIMMSSHDSVSMVFKCMLKDAADFLVKPIRKNELTNLWQHVWRRQSSNGATQAEQDENIPQTKMDAIEVNNAASNHSSDNVAGVQKNREDSEKGSDTQSSRTKQDMEVESPYVGNMQEPLHPKHPGNSQASNDNVEQGEEDMIYEFTSQMPEKDKWRTLSTVLTPHNQATGSDGKRAEKKVHARDTFEDCNEKLAMPCEEAIDLIGALDNHPQFTCTNKGWSFARGSNDAGNHTGEKADFSSLSSPLLELSLRRSLLNCCDDEIREKHTLNHSNASAFSRYNNTIVKPQVIIPTNLANETREGTSSNYMSTSNPVTPNSSASSRGQISVPVPMRGIGYEGLSSGYGSMMQPVFYGSPGVPLWSENSGSQHELITECSPRQPNEGTHNYEHSQNIHGQTPSKPIYRPMPRQDQNADSYKDLMHVQSVTIPSGSSSLCNGSNNHINSNGVGSVCNGSNNHINSNGIGSVCNGGNNHINSNGVGSVCNGSNNHINSNGIGSVCNGSNNRIGSNGIGSVCNGSGRNLAVTTNAADNGINDGRYANEGVGIMNFWKLSEREAALNKFRLKRKDRCFEKKVRYQSRKKLAEQRPRVKGQFVRQVQYDP